MHNDNRPFDWTRFFVQFFFGAIFGGLAGLYFGAGAATRTEFLLWLGGTARRGTHRRACW